MTRPNCMACNKPLAKYTDAIFFSESQDGKPLPRTRAEAQQRTNKQVVSVRWTVPSLKDKAGDTIYDDRTGRAIPDQANRRAWCVGTWDGESYGHHGEGLFCNGSCAQGYGYAWARRVRKQQERVA